MQFATRLQKEVFTVCSYSEDSLDQFVTMLKAIALLVLLTAISCNSSYGAPAEANDDSAAAKVEASDNAAVKVESSDSDVAKTVETSELVNSRNHRRILTSTKFYY